MTLGLIAIIIFTSIYVANSSGNDVKNNLSNNNNIEFKGINPITPPTFVTNQLSEGLTKIGQLDVDFGNAYKVTAEDDLLLVAGLSGGVTFIDVSNNSEPVVLGNYWSGGEVTDAIYKDGYCYTANLETGIECLDYSDYDDIQSLGSFYDGGECNDIEFIGFTTLYAADGSDGLEIYSIADGPGNFSKIRAEKFGVSEVLGIRADPLNNIAFIMCGTDGIIALDITRPTTPQVITVMKDGSTNAQMADSSALALYVADGQYGLKIYNYSDQDNIYLSDHFEIDSGFCEYFEWDVAKRAYITTGDYLAQLNISDIHNITEYWRVSYSPGAAKGMQTITSHIYLCNDYDFKIIDISNKSNPVIQSEITFAGEPSATDVSGDLAILAEGLTGIDLINITDPLNPVLISKYEDESGGTSFYDVAIDGDYAFCATSSGLEVIDISDVYNPISVRKVNSGNARVIEISGNYVYLSVSSKDFVVIDISNPLTASEITHLNTLQLPQDIAIEGSYAYVAVGTSGIQKIDISTPSTPSVVDTQDTTDAQGVAIQSNVLGVADGTAGILFYDVSVIGSITLLDSTLTTGYEFTKIVMDGNDAFVAAYEDGIMYLNITDTANVEKIAHFSDGGEDIHLTIENTLLFAADTIDSFEIVGKDTDLDAVADYAEINVWGTNPSLNDTDLDGLLDGEEIDYWDDRGVNPLDDWDGDSIPNLLDDDSDNDTILDGVEVHFYGSDPIDLDSDDDFIPDEEEVIIGSDGFITHPAMEDTDLDWIIDGNETLGYY